MDKSHISSRIANYQSTVGGSATTRTNNSFGTVTIPLTPHREFGASGPSATEAEFKSRAKEYKKTQLKRNILKKLAIFGIFLGVIIVLMGIAGLVLNQRYSGRALPYSYIGDISIGGLTAAEIKDALDLKASQTTVTFTEAGLTRTVPLSMFSAKFDTEKAAQNAMVGFNPFEFLTPRNFSVPVQIEANQVDGYLQLYVADKQKPSENAEIIKGKEGLTIKPEVQGYRTSTAYVVDQLQKQLKEMKDPVISLSAAAEQPSITQSDLEDDIDQANKMVASDVALQVWNTKVAPSTEDKISWLEIKQNQGLNGVTIQFSQAKVREYVLGLAQRYEFEPQAESIATNEDGSQYIKAGKNGQKVKNTDVIATKFYQALVSQQNGLFSFDFEYTEHQKIDRQSINLVTTPVRAVATESPAAEEPEPLPENPPTTQATPLAE